MDTLVPPAAGANGQARVPNRRVRVRVASYTTLLYQLPCFWPNHQTSPNAAVFCSFLKIPRMFVKKNGRFEKSRRHSPRIRKPSENEYSVVNVVSFKAWVITLNKPPRCRWLLVGQSDCSARQAVDCHTTRRKNYKASVCLKGRIVFNNTPSFVLSLSRQSIDRETEEAPEEKSSRSQRTFPGFRVANFHTT